MPAILAEAEPSLEISGALGAASGGHDDSASSTEPAQANPPSTSTGRSGRVAAASVAGAISSRANGLTMPPVSNTRAVI